MVKKSNKNVRSGFTLIEMTIVLFIISLLIMIVIPNLANQRNHAQTIHTSAMKSMVKAQVDAYQSQHPNNDHISYEALAKDGYLTAKQVAQAKKAGIKISKSDGK
ncbi:competence type IV pilus major pilin ComGC [Lentilactobacillus farraginis]|uniref:Competence protein GC n=1 Tax=Lentilactobacillus farraginis DSM 18382 = JCM 14108 TaxID=1423743 RepID=X0P959_9LACO|nr:competence type IV pilus major pilin ComGC [Lentilactobacillus farraginis]KRM10029.1 competence protein GC [Lentilactobacillus farraginis DSM 18382 = JCM 14108]GAF35178.1 late competence protein ComGC [Lentilactobacillus farraginis DSM 18382 = JCM 14108]